MPAPWSLIRPIFFAAACLWPKVAAGEAAPPAFEVPVACALGSECVVQNYIDHEPGPGARDQTCGPLAYDGHRGVDFRLPGLRHMAAGVAVLAAAPGRVLRVRDGAPDISYRAEGATARLGHEAGNEVVIDHGQGWRSRYAHLRQGSVAVAPGQRVAAGARLGLIGLSGKTEFPHLHFSIERAGRILDPFTGLAPEGGCGRPGTPLLSAAARARLAYRAGGLLDQGFAIGPVDFEAVLGPEAPAQPDPDSPALVYWAVAWGLRAGDRETLRLTGPEGKTIGAWSGTLSADQAQSLRFTGGPRRGQAWPPGSYRGTYRVTRELGGEAAAILETAFEIDLP